MNPVTNKPVTNQPAPVRNSFSIENILSKPDRIDRIVQQPNLAIFATNDSMEQSIYCKNDPNNSIYDENSNIDECNSGDVKSEQSESRNSFATPDSSCCEDGADALSDIQSEENCEYEYTTH